jgi:hypothetical protein
MTRQGIGRRAFHDGPPLPAMEWPGNVDDPDAVDSRIEVEMIRKGKATMPNTRAPKGIKRRSGGAPDVAASDFYVDTGDGEYVRYNVGDRLQPEHVGLPMVDVAKVKPKGDDPPNIGPTRDLDEHPPSPEPHEAA